MKLLLDESMKIGGKIQSKGTVVDVTEDIGKEILAAKKGRSVDSATGTAVVSLPPEKLTVASIKKDAPDAYKEISESAYEEGFKAAEEETKKALKNAVNTELIKKEFPGVYEEIFNAGKSESESEESAKKTGDKKGK